MSIFWWKHAIVIFDNIELLINDPFLDPPWVRFNVRQFAAEYSLDMQKMLTYTWIKINALSNIKKRQSNTKGGYVRVVTSKFFQWYNWHWLGPGVTGFATDGRSTSKKEIDCGFTGSPMEGVNTG